MGSLSSRPSAPQTSTVFVSQPAPITEPVSATPTPEEVAQQEAAEAKTQDQEESKRRAQNLLQNRRGRGSTILSSFRGVLQQNDGGLQRKTLLGE